MNICTASNMYTCAFSCLGVLVLPQLGLAIFNKMKNNSGWSTSNA